MASVASSLEPSVNWDQQIQCDFLCLCEEKVFTMHYNESNLHTFHHKGPALSDMLHVTQGPAFDRSEEQIDNVTFQSSCHLSNRSQRGGSWVTNCINSTFAVNTVNTSHCGQHMAPANVFPTGGSVLTSTELKKTFALAVLHLSRYS